MLLSAVSARIAPIAIAIVLGLSLSACGGLISSRTQGYDLSEDALTQIRPGQSQDLVTIVLGSPQTTNSFGDESAFYYVETRVSETAFGLTTIQSRKVVAIYFDKNKKVKDKAVYGLQDGRAVTIETRRTPSFGEDRTFIESILKSF